LEVGSFGLGCDRKDLWGTPNQPSLDEIHGRLAKPTAERIWYIRYAFKAGLSVDDIFRSTHIDRWFLHNLREIIAVEDKLRAVGTIDHVRANAAAFTDLIWEAKQHGFSDRQLAHLWHANESEVRRLRHGLGVLPTYKRVDTCAAEFEAYTPYYYSAYERPEQSPLRPLCLVCPIRWMTKPSPPPARPAS
jgi:carbamoyl-phosphate synthase large subunit